MIFIDIETVPNEKALKSDAWKRYLKKHPEKTDHDAGLMPAFGQVVCICASIKDNENKFVSFSECLEDEKKILTRFKSWLDFIASENFYLHDILCAHNGKGFDFPFLAARYVACGLMLPNVLKTAGKKPWEINHVDTMELLKFGGWSAMSLDAACFMLEVQTPKDDIDGSQVWDEFKKGNLSGIKMYCEKDVSALEQVYFKLWKMGAI